MISCCRLLVFLTWRTQSGVDEYVFGRPPAPLDCIRLIIVLPGYVIVCVAIPTVQQYQPVRPSETRQQHVRNTSETRQKHNIHDESSCSNLWGIWVAV